MTEHDHFARLGAMTDDRGLVTFTADGLAWAVKTIRQQEARIAELERLNDAAVRSMKFAKETMDLGTETINRLLAEKGDRG